MMTGKAHVLQIEEGQRDDASPPPDEADQTLSRAQASEYLRTRWGLSYARRTLVVYAVRGTGPEYFRIGARVAYRREALDAWAKSKVTAPGRKASDLKSIMEIENGNV